ncbi:MAG: disulfide bond formation protein B [Pelagimonas sp.]|jgi:disulfide bond formation protein DsbB|nr:disulfide bond formation protein B [Pelagimonas sp.]
MNSKRALIALGTAGSAGLLLGALGFQYLGDMPPCKLCYWQRYGHVLALVAGVLAFWKPNKFLIALAGLGVASSSVVGGYHTGVERKWWEGPNSCTSGSVEGLTPEELLQQIMNAPLVRCDEVPWELFTLSMASWNMLASGALALIFVAALRR